MTINKVWKLYVGTENVSDRSPASAAIREALCEAFGGCTQYTAVGAWIASSGMHEHEFTDVYEVVIGGEENDEKVSTEMLRIAGKARVAFGQDCVLLTSQELHDVIFVRDGSRSRDVDSVEMPCEACETGAQCLIPGVLLVHSGMGEAIERCDACERYSSDEDAAQALIRHMR